MQLCESRVTARRIIDNIFSSKQKCITSENKMLGVAGILPTALALSNFSQFTDQLLPSGNFKTVGVFYENRTSDIVTEFLGRASLVVNVQLQVLNIH